MLSIRSEQEFVRKTLTSAGHTGGIRPDSTQLIKTDNVVAAEKHIIRDSLMTLLLHAIAHRRKTKTNEQQQNSKPSKRMKKSSLLRTFPIYSKHRQWKHTPSKRPRPGIYSRKIMTALLVTRALGEWGCFQRNRKPAVIDQFYNAEGEKTQDSWALGECGSYGVAVDSMRTLGSLSLCSSWIKYESGSNLIWRDFGVCTAVE